MFKFLHKYIPFMHSDFSLNSPHPKSLLQTASDENVIGIAIASETLPTKKDIVQNKKMFKIVETSSR